MRLYVKDFEANLVDDSGEVVYTERFKKGVYHHSMPPISWIGQIDGLTLVIDQEEVKREKPRYLRRAGDFYETSAKQDFKPRERSVAEIVKQQLEALKTDKDFVESILSARDADNDYVIAPAKESAPDVKLDEPEEEREQEEKETGE